jgi:hypothetical protein
MLTDHAITSDQGRCLRDQTITDDQPGSVLRDFEMLLGFLEPNGVEAGGKCNLIHLKFIKELDLRLTRPLRLEMPRPQIKSHPYIQGLSLLLRASGLTRVDGTGSKARLVVDPEMLIQWEQLNPTERYFNLLEAWLRIGREQMIGEDGRSWMSLLAGALEKWHSVVQHCQRYETKKRREIYAQGYNYDLYSLALMDLFGLVEVEFPTGPVKPWHPADAKNLPFGDALFSLLLSQPRTLRGADLLAEDEEDDGTDADEDGDASGEDEAEGILELPRFGAWQPLFQPYFPDWRQNLELPAVEPREGTFVFRVSWARVWRLIALPADDTFDDLVNIILRSMNFDDDHLYAFRLIDRLGSTTTINHPAMDSGPWTDQVRVGALPLEPGQSMELEYDFGDQWKFDVRLERIEPPTAKMKQARVIERHGKAPRQYPRWDEDY